MKNTLELKGNNAVQITNPDDWSPPMPTEPNFIPPEFLEEIHGGEAFQAALEAALKPDAFYMQGPHKIAYFVITMRSNIALVLVGRYDGNDGECVGASQGFPADKAWFGVDIDEGGYGLQEFRGDQRHRVTWENIRKTAQTSSDDAPEPPGLWKPGDNPRGLWKPGPGDSN